MTDSATLLSAATNYAVVQLPGRRFPGIVFQGDSTHNALVQLRRIEALAKMHGDKELDAKIAGLCELFASVITHYEAVCESRGIELPYLR
jgi:hypothetical protein